MIHSVTFLISINHPPPHELLYDTPQILWRLHFLFSSYLFSLYLVTFLTGDVDMAEGIKDPQVILKIGLVNDKVEQRLDAYKKVFDVLILHDGTFDFLLELLREILV